VREALRAALLRGRNRPRNLGAGSPTIFRGDGLEFAELREYVAGDDPRRIDWAATARAGALQTRVVLEDVALTLAGILDDSGSMRVGRKRPLGEAAHQALAGWFQIAASDDRCVRVTGDGLVAPPGMRGERSALVCANAPSRTPTNVPEALALASAVLPRGTALLVISDFLDCTDAHRALLTALGTRLDCTALVAQDPWEADLPLRGFVTMRDAETGRTERFFFSPRARRRFQRAARERAAATMHRFHAAGWRCEGLDEADGARALSRAFGLR